MKKLFRGTRRYTTYESVEISAETFDDAVEKIESDNEDVKILTVTDDGFEILGELKEIKE